VTRQTSPPEDRLDIAFPPQDASLRDDVHELGVLVGEMLAEQGGAAFLDRVEEVGRSHERLAAFGLDQRRGRRQAAGQRRGLRLLQRRRVFPLLALLHGPCSDGAVVPRACQVLDERLVVQLPP